MKIVLATPLYPPDSGGPATDAAHIAAALPKYDMEPVICTFGAVRHLPPGIRHLWYAAHLYGSSKGASALLAMDTFSVCVPAAIVSKLRGVPLVVRVPGDFAWEQSTQRFGVTDTIEAFQHKRYSFRVESIRAVQRWALRSAAKVIAPSDFFLNIMSTWGIAPDRLMRIYLGIDLDEPFAIPQQIPEGKILFSLGRFVPWKGFLLLVDLMRELSQDWHLVIVGDGPHRPVVEERIKSLGLESRVTLTGVIDRPLVLGWFRVSHAYALNTSQENFSFQVVEGMNAGVPTITTPIGSIPELLTNGVEGVLCEVDDRAAFLAAIQSTETEPGLWRTRTEAAKHKAQTFSHTASVSALAAELMKVIAPKA